MNIKSIIIIGQTASGKTNLAHKLFNELNKASIKCEVVNLDAFQIYKDISIGTAKPSIEEQKRYHYHGIDLCESHESMDANLFAEYLRKTCTKILNKGKFPICVGGSGLYLRAFLHGLDNFPTHNPQIRKSIRDDAAKNGWEACYERLKQIDPVRAATLHPNDHVRIERALEIYEITQTPPSQLQTKTKPLHSQERSVASLVIQTEVESEILKENIFIRTQNLFRSGWYDEVKKLHIKYGENLKNFNSMRAIGYKSILDSIIQNKDVFEEQELILKISNETCKYAKRQKTWNKKEKIDLFVNPQNQDDFEELLKISVQILKK